VDRITVANGNGGTKDFNYVAASVTTVDQLVAAINGDTTVAGLTVEADRDAYHEQLVTISYTSSDGLQETTSSTNGKIYFTYGTDPETGLAIATQTADVAAGASGVIAAAIATALNLATSAYAATAATDGEILITATVSGSATAEDRGPIPHAFQTLSIDAGSASTTKLLAGDAADTVVNAVAASNTTAIASGYFTLTSGAVTKSGVRVTIKNSSTAVSLASMAVTVGATSAAFIGNGIGAANAGINGIATALTAGTNIAAATVNSSTLDYVAGFSDIESPVSTTPTITNRTGW
jgi:hypothetical protein